MLKSTKNFFTKFLATTFFSGYSPYAPGTVSSILVISLLYILFSVLKIHYTMLHHFVTLTILFIIGILVCREKQLFSNNEDPQEITIDEAIGIMAAITPLVSLNKLNSIYFMSLALITFRILDITKPSIIGIIDKKVKNEIGIILDDFAAGIISAIILLVVNWLINYL